MSKEDDRETDGQSPPFFGMHQTTEKTRGSVRPTPHDFVVDRKRKSFTWRRGHHREIRRSEPGPSGRESVEEREEAADNRGSDQVAYHIVQESFEGDEYRGEPLGCCGALWYAFFFIPYWPDLGGWIMIIETAIICLPREVFSTSLDLFYETMYFTVTITIICSILQTLFLHTQYGFCKNCAGALPKWKRYGPFILVVIATCFLLVEPIVFAAQAAWHYEHCEIVYYKQPFSVKCDISKMYSEKTERQSKMLRCYGGHSVLIFAVVWVTDVFNNFIGDYLEAREGPPSRHRSHGSSSMSLSQGGQMCCCARY